MGQQLKLDFLFVFLVSLVLVKLNDLINDSYPARSNLLFPGTYIDFFPTYFLPLNPPYSDYLRNLKPILLHYTYTLSSNISDNLKFLHDCFLYALKIFKISPPSLMLQLRYTSLYDHNLWPKLLMSTCNYQATCVHGCRTCLQYNGIELMVICHMFVHI